MGGLEDLDTLVTNGRLEDLDTMFMDAVYDTSLMPAVVAETRRLMYDRDPTIRTWAAAIAFSAVRGVYSRLSPADRVALSDAVSIDLEAAFTTGLVEGAPENSPMWSAYFRAKMLRGVLRRVRERGGELD
jgi:hypothetical protein